MSTRLVDSGVSTDSVPTATALVAVGLLVCAAMYALMTVPAGLFDSLIEEDGVIEMVGALGLFAASGLAAGCFARGRRQGRPLLLQLSYLVLAVFFFLAGGEEISWGQRIFGYSTPQAIDEINNQGEFNVHNVSGLGSTPEAVFLASWLVLAVAIPLAARYGPAAVRTTLERVVPVAPVAFTVLFVGNYVLAKAAQAAVDAWGRYVSEYAVVHSVTEIKETNFELLFAVMLLWLWLRRHDIADERAART